MRRLVIGLLLPLLVLPTVRAQIPSSLTVGGELRQRSRLDARDFDADTAPADVHLLRTRLHAAVEPADRVEVFVQVQDSRRFGAGDPARARGTMDPSAGQLDLHQVYFEVDGLLGANLSLKGGRQELAYGNQRLIGAVGWSNVGRTFDAGVLSYEGDRASADFFAARLVGSPLEGTGSENLFGLYSTWAVGGAHSLEAFALFDNNTNEIEGGEGTMVDRLARFTPGITLRGDTSPLSYVLEAAYQTGKEALSGRKGRLSIQASLLSAYAEYGVRSASGLTLGAGYTRLSGDDDRTDDEEGTFNTLFATNHKFYGFIDSFLSTPERGLQDAHVKTSIRLSEQVQLEADFHYFAQAAAPSGRSVQRYGEELDLTARYHFADPVTFQVGLSGFRPGPAMEALQDNDDLAFWAYLMSTIRF